MAGMRMARQYWERATELGTPNATTTFHTLYNKHDIDQRPFALGYLGWRKFLKWLQSEAGRAVTGVDCTKPSRNQMRQDRVRRTADEFFQLCVKYSKRKEVQPGDYSSVGQVRSLPDSSYCLFVGFGEALLSAELPVMIARWKSEESAELALFNAENPVVTPAAAPAAPPPPPPAPVPPAPSVGSQTTEPAPAPATPGASSAPPEPQTETTAAETQSETAADQTPAHPTQVPSSEPPGPLQSATTASASSHVQEMGDDDDDDDDDDDAVRAAVPAPAPVLHANMHDRALSPVHKDDRAPAPEFPPSKRAKTTTKRVPDPNASISTASWPINSIGKLVLRDFNAGKANAKSITFGPTSAYTFNVRGDYKIVLKKRREGRTGASGTTDAYVYLDGESKRIAGISQLRSVPEITRHFNEHPNLNKILSI